MSKRKTALKTIERKAWGGSYYDSFTHAAMFRSYKPYNFGVKTSQLFSSELGSHIINKKFTYMTVAQGNVFVLPGGTDDYEWSLVGEADVDFRISEQLVADSDYPGKGGMRFKFALDRGWVHEPTLLKVEDPNLPMIRVIGHSVKRSANSHEYVGELQTGDLNVWIPVDYLKPGKRLVDASTMVSDELNTKFAGDQFGEMFKLQSWVGNFARKCEFTDKFIRTEIACRKEGRPMPKNQGYSIGGNSYRDGAIGVGYVYQQEFTSKGGGVAVDNQKSMIEKGVFVTKMEARLLERVERDREMNMEFGQLQKSKDYDSDRPVKVAPGWRQIARDGHYKEHNGSLTLSDLYEYISEIFVTRRAFKDRRIVIATGEPGIELLHRMIAMEASQFQFVDTQFVRERKDPQGYHMFEKEFGSQFTRIRLPMGYVLEMVHDPIKDDRKLFPQLAPGTNRTLEGYAMDIFDFGATDQKAFDASREENITMVMQDGVETYFTVSNVYDFETGAIKDGSNAFGFNKELGIYREVSGSLCVWDVSRCGRIEFNPFKAA